MAKKKWSLLVVLALLLGIAGYLSSRTSFANSDNVGANVETPLAFVNIHCQAGQGGNPPTVTLFPETINIVVNDTVQWVISGSCMNVFTTMIVDVPTLPWTSPPVPPPLVIGPTPAIGMGNHPYTVTAIAPNQNVVENGTIIARPPIPNPILIAFQDVAGNPYCDGMTMNHQLPNGYAIQGSFCGCDTTPMQGNFVGQANPVIPIGTGALIFTPNYQIFTKITFNPRAWAHYFFSDPINPFNSGTFAYGCPVMEGGASSFGD